MKTLTLFSFLAALLSAQMVFAEITSAPEVKNDFQKQVLEAQKNCPHLDCDGTSVQVEAYGHDEFRSLPKELRAQLKNAAVLLAHELWPDTILEGSYLNADRYRVEALEKVLNNGVQVGYRITYSDKAWNTDTCDFNPQIPESIAKCETGRITDSAFISLDLQTTLRDEAAWAAYSPDNAVVQPGLDD